MTLALVIGCLACLATLGAGCGKLLGPKEAAPLPSYPDGPEGLKSLFSAVLAAGLADDRPLVHAYFQSLKMTKPELDRLFGPRAAEISPVYEEMMSTLINRGSVELVAMIYEKKYDAVEVLPVTLPPLDGEKAIGPMGANGMPAGPRPDELALTRTLVSPPQLYSVRFKKTGESLGTRYDFLFYSDGHWRTGNQLGKAIAKRDADLTATPPTR